MNPLVKLKTNVTGDMFSSVEDPEKYNGTVLIGGYLSEVRKQHHETIHLHLEREVTKIPADTLACDVLYKEGKSLCCYRGQPIFKGLVSGLDPAGCVRVLFRVVTDPQDQFDAAIEAFLKTLDEYGQPQPCLFYTDNQIIQQPWQATTSTVI